MIISCVLVALILGVSSVTVNNNGVLYTTDPVVANTWICTYMSSIAAWLGITCPSQSASTSTTSTTTGPISTGSAVTTVATGSSSTTTPASPLARATWCRLNNGTYLAYNYTFMNGLCTYCQCTASRLVTCLQFQCMAAYCIDNTMPSRRAGQCCAQCSTDVQSNSCTSPGISVPIPNGAIIRNDKTMKCWCQWGQIECRTGISSIFDDLDLWGDGTAAYVIVVVLAVLLIFGTLLCCGCTLCFYYYYQRNQAAFQQAYAQYYNSAGWQPMTDEEGLATVVDADKEAEAEQGQFESEQYLAEVDEASKSTQGYMPPPYALYNGAYVSEDHHNEKKL